MKRYAIFIILICIVQIQCIKTPQTFSDQYYKYYSEIQKYNEFSYKVKFKQKRYSSDDFFEHEAEVFVQTDTMDKLFGARFVINLEDRIYFYNRSNIGQLLKGDNMLTLADPKANPNVFIKSTEYNGLLLRQYITKGDLLVQLVNADNMKVDTTLFEKKGKKIIRIQADIDDAQGFSDEFYQVNIDTETNFYSMITYQSLFQGNYQIDSTFYEPIAFDANLFNKYMDEKLGLKHNNVEMYASDQEKYVDVIGNTLTLNGQYFKTQKHFDLSKSTNKLNVFDFYYSGCYPCIQSIPIINALSDKYKSEKIGFYGLNTIDKNNKSHERLKRFIDKNKMNYSTILFDKNDLNGFEVRAYPHFIILNSNDEIIFSSAGHSEDLFEILDSIIMHNI